MKEIITIDGKQFELITEYPLTEEQRQQAISEIRKQSKCDSCNKTQSLEGSIQTLYTPCIDVTIQVPATIAVANVTILGTNCSSGTCPPISCTSLTDCTITRSIVVTYENSGDIDAAITPTLTVKIGGITVGPAEYTTTTVPASVPAKSGSVNGSAVATFSGVTLDRGTNNICADFRVIP